MRRAGFLCAIAGAVLCLGSGGATLADECAFTPWRTFKGTQLYRHAAFGAYYYTTTHKAIDADGAPNAYHPDDVGKNCSNDPHLGLDCPANAGYPNTTWWSSVLVRDPDTSSRPYRQETGEFAGFFVAMTWLTAPDLAKTDIRKYVDSTKVPYIVMPGSDFPDWSGTGSMGDVGMAWHLERGWETAFIIADKGGGADARLGEASIDLFVRLGYEDPNPRTGAGLDGKAIRYLVFPGSRANTDPDWPQEVGDIEKHAQRLLDELGGEAVFENCP